MIYDQLHLTYHIEIIKIEKSIYDYDLLSNHDCR